MLVLHVQAPPLRLGKGKTLFASRSTRQTFVQAVDKAFVADICKSTNVNLEFDLEVLDKVLTDHVGADIVCVNLTNITKLLCLHCSLVHEMSRSNHGCSDERLSITGRCAAPVPGGSLCGR